MGLTEEESLLMPGSLRLTQELWHQTPLHVNYSSLPTPIRHKSSELPLSTRSLERETLGGYPSSLFCRSRSILEREQRLTVTTIGVDSVHVVSTGNSYE